MTACCSRLEALRESIEKSLRQLRTDYLDVMYLHGVPPDILDDVIDRFQEPLQKAQQDGLVRFLGITETFATDHEHITLRTVIPQGFFDVVMVGYNVMSPAPPSTSCRSRRSTMWESWSCAPCGVSCSTRSASAKSWRSGRTRGCSRVTPCLTMSRSGG